MHEVQGPRAARRDAIESGERVIRAEGARKWGCAASIGEPQPGNPDADVGDDDSGAGKDDGGIHSGRLVVGDGEGRRLSLIEDGTTGARVVVEEGDDGAGGRPERGTSE